MASATSLNARSYRVPSAARGCSKRMVRRGQGPRCPHENQHLLNFPPMLLRRLFGVASPIGSLHSLRAGFFVHLDDGQVLHTGNYSACVRCSLLGHMGTDKPAMSSTATAECSGSSETWRAEQLALPGRLFCRKSVLWSKLRQGTTWARAVRHPQTLSSRILQPGATWRRVKRLAGGTPLNCFGMLTPPFVLPERASPVIGPFLQSMRSNLSSPSTTASAGRKERPQHCSPCC